MHSIYKKFLASTLALLTLTGAALPVYPSPHPVSLLAEASDGVALTEAYFPDVAFRTALAACLAVEEGTVLTEEQLATEKLALDYCEIEDLTGIGNFTKLKELTCIYNRLTTLDLSQNTELLRLDCSGNQLDALDVSKNEALEYLHCSSNNMTTLVLPHSGQLQQLYCMNNNLTTLNLDNFTKMEYFDCGTNQLTALDLTDMTSLVECSCRSNALTSIDITPLSALQDFTCSNNKLESLDVSGNPLLRELSCNSNMLTELDVTSCPVLRDLECGDNLLKTLDLSQNPNLKVLHVNQNSFSELDVSQNPLLTILWCQRNLLTTLDLSANPDLVNLNCSSNAIFHMPIPEGLTTFKGEEQCCILTTDTVTAPADMFVDDVQYAAGETVTFRNGSAFSYVEEGVSGNVLLYMPETVPVYGDVNLDGNVNIADVIMLNRALLGDVVLEEQQRSNADVDKNGTPEAADSLHILKFIVELVETLPIA